MTFAIAKQNFQKLDYTIYLKRIRMERHRQFIHKAMAKTFLICQGFNICHILKKFYSAQKYYSFMREVLPEGYYLILFIILICELGHAL